MKSQIDQNNENGISLRASSRGRYGGEAGKGGRACNFALEFEFQLQFQGCGSPSTELSDFRRSARSGNELECNKHRKTRAMGNDVITKADISPSWHYNSLATVNVPKQQLSNFPRVKMGILKLTVRAYTNHFKQIYLLS